MKPARNRLKSRPYLLSLLAALLLCLPLGTERSWAGSTDPVLGIGAARAIAVGNAALLEISGVWALDDILQVNFPLNVVVSQGGVFARFPVGSPAESGLYSGLSDGLSISEIALVEATGSSDPAASILRLDHHLMRLALPPVFSDGVLNVVLYVELPLEGSFLSNTATATLSGLGGGSP